MSIIQLNIYSRRIFVSISMIHVTLKDNVQLSIRNVLIYVISKWRP